MVENPRAGGSRAPAAPEARLAALTAHYDAAAAEGVRAAGAWRAAGGEAGLDDALATADILAALDLDPDCVAAALLWTPPRPPALAAPAAAAPAEHFGGRVSALAEGAERMAAITGWMDLDRESRVAHGEGLRRLLLAMVEDPRVVLMALAERLHRLRGARALNEGERLRLARAAREAWAPLASRLGVWQLKWELEDLAFRELEPETYHALAKRLQERRVDREEYIADVVAKLGAGLLREAGLAAEVYGRPKHLYSIWRKMRSKHLEFERVFDVRAVRVLVDTVADCYAALGVVHSLWPHIRGEFDDYITSPKGNRYQSLHTAVIGPGGRTLEVQIRTHEMHQRAEHGVAAHWRYKEGRGGASERDVDQKIEWLRQVLEWKEQLEEPGGPPQAVSPDEAERVYVVTPRGDVVDLEAGATPLDFAYHVHTDVGHRCRGAKVDGAIVPLTHRLRSGERVEILTGKQPSPSRDWMSPHLGYLRTGRARAKVRAWFKQQDYAHNLAEGRELFERELKRLGLGKVDPQTLAARFNLQRGDDVLAALGRGDVSSAQLATALTPLVPEAESPRPAPRGRRKGDGSGGVEIAGVGDLLTTVAGCCRPVPPDDIVGYVTRGRGVSIHRRDCRNVLGLEGEERARLLEVSWSGDDRHLYPVNVRVAAWERPGLLRDVTMLLAAEHANVVSVDMQTDRKRQLARIDMVLEVKALSQLSRVLERLAQLPNVVEARRRGD